MSAEDPPKLIEHDPERGCAHGGGACPIFSDGARGMWCEAMRLEVRGVLVVRPGSGL